MPTDESNQIGPIGSDSWGLLSGQSFESILANIRRNKPKPGKNITTDETEDGVVINFTPGGPCNTQTDLCSVPIKFQEQIGGGYSKCGFGTVGTRHYLDLSYTQNFSSTGCDETFCSESLSYRHADTRTAPANPNPNGVNADSDCSGETFLDYNCVTHCDSPFSDTCDSTCTPECDSPPCLFCVDYGYLFDDPEIITSEDGTSTTTIGHREVSCDPGPGSETYDITRTIAFSNEYTTEMLFEDVLSSIPEWSETFTQYYGTAVHFLSEDESTLILTRFRYKWVIPIPYIPYPAGSILYWQELFYPQGSLVPTLFTTKSFTWDGVATESPLFYVYEPNINGYIDVGYPSWTPP